MNIRKPMKLGGITLTNTLMNGAYIGSKTKEDIEILAKSSCGAIVVGSITVKPRNVNKDSGYWRHKENLYSLNSFGMPNGGYAYFKEQLPEMTVLAHRYNKPLIANIAGFNAEEFVMLAKLAQESDVDMLELNLGCPNVWDKGRQKQIASYHPAVIEQVLTAIRLSRISTKICIKLSPLPPDILHEVAKVIIDAKCVHAVTATNSYPNALLTTESAKTSPPFAGLAGRALKPISLGVVKQLRKLLPKEIDIIGAGGISSFRDVIDYLQAGASAVQIATALVDEGPSVFDKIYFQSHQPRALS